MKSSKERLALTYQHPEHVANGILSPIAIYNRYLFVKYPLERQHIWKDAMKSCPAAQFPTNYLNYFAKIPIEPMHLY